MVAGSTSRENCTRTLVEVATSVSSSVGVLNTTSGGGPAGTTETLTVYAYRALFQTLQLGFGSALSVVVFLLVMAVAWAYLKILRTGTVAA